MPVYKKILVVCPAGAVTGGPEALHQLVHHMNQLDLPAYLCYQPFDALASAPLPYQRYLTQSTLYEDAPGNLIIFPEVEPMLALKVKHAQAAIWWLSLENFLERRHISLLYDKVRYYKRVLQGRRPWRGANSLRSLIHFSQTEHATQYLQMCGIEPIPLIDSINEDFLTNKFLDRIDHKKNIILFNPTKGKSVTNALIAAYPQFDFIPLQGLERDQLSQYFYSAKLYIDFGHHPGRDRMPREAAMHGCCLITGRLGSAGNNIDLPIPQHYKLDSNHAEFMDQFGQLANQIMTHFPEHYKNFSSYRQWLQNEPKIFRTQICNYFCK